MAKKRKQKKSKKAPRVALSRGDFSNLKLEEGDTLTGTYLGSKEHIGGFGAVEIHYFQKDAGFRSGPGVCLFGTAELNFKLMQVPKGALVKVERQEAVELFDPETLRPLNRRLFKFDVQYWSKG